MFPSADTSPCSPLPSSGYRGRPSSLFSSREPCGSPPSQVVWGRKTAHHPSRPPPVSLGSRYLPYGAEVGSSPGFTGNPFGSMPRAGDSGDPESSSHIGRPGAAFRQANGVGIRNDETFSELVLHGLLPRCVRFVTRQSPGEWQHSLPACPLRL